MEVFSESRRRAGRWVIVAMSLLRKLHRAGRPEKKSAKVPSDVFLRVFWWDAAAAAASCYLITRYFQAAGLSKMKIQIVILSLLTGRQLQQLTGSKAGRPAFMHWIRKHEKRPGRLYNFSTELCANTKKTTSRHVVASSTLFFRANSPFNKFF